MAQTFSFSARPASTEGLRIHPTAVVEPGALIGRDVEIGPHCVVQAGARIGDRVRLVASVHLAAGVDVGDDCTLHVGAVIGQPPQMRCLQGPVGGTIIGPRTIVREHVTVHSASRPGTYTTVGAGNLLMAGSHVAHDCRTGEGVTLANNALLAGWVQVDDHAFVSGNVAVHQFVRIGRLVMVGGLSRVTKDVPPFMLVGRSRVRGVNVVGLRRAGMDASVRQLVRRAFLTLYCSRLSVSTALQRIQGDDRTAEIDELLAFVAASTRGLCRGPRRARRTASPLDR